MIIVDLFLARNNFSNHQKEQIGTYLVELYL